MFLRSLRNTVVSAVFSTSCHWPLWEVHSPLGKFPIPGIWECSRPYSCSSALLRVRCHFKDSFGGGGSPYAGSHSAVSPRLLKTGCTTWRWGPQLGGRGCFRLTSLNDRPRLLTIYEGIITTLWYLKCLQIIKSIEKGRVVSNKYGLIIMYPKTIENKSNFFQHHTSLFSLSNAATIQTSFSNYISAD